MMNNEKSKWFEKTVEYAFVRRFSDFLACPLDGRLEAMGDALFSSDDKFFLVEFKVDGSSFSVNSERKKYSNPDSSIFALQENLSSSCHWVVFGVVQNNRFFLAIKNYLNFLSQSPGGIKLNALKSHLIHSAVDYEDFCLYLTTVIKEKLKTDPPTGPLGITSLENMLVVNEKGVSASVFEAIYALNLEKKVQLESKNRKVHILAFGSEMDN